MSREIQQEGSTHHSHSRDPSTQMPPLNTHCHNCYGKWGTWQSTHWLLKLAPGGGHTSLLLIFHWPKQVSGIPGIPPSLDLMVWCHWPCSPSNKERSRYLLQKRLNTFLPAHRWLPSGFGKMTCLFAMPRIWSCFTSLTKPTMTESNLFYVLREKSEDRFLKRCLHKCQSFGYHEFSLIPSIGTSFLTSLPVMG